MEIITTYKSVDGKMFDDELECRQHELDILESISDLEIYGPHNKRLHVWYSEATYNKSVKIVIPSELAVEDLMQIQHFCGFYCDIPANIESIGVWKFNRTSERFERV